MGRCPAGAAYWAGWVLAWREHDAEEALGLLWQRVAYATRYGRATLTEVLRLDQSHLEGYLRAVNKIVEQENDKGSPGAAFQNYT